MSSHILIENITPSEIENTTVILILGYQPKKKKINILLHISNLAKLRLKINTEQNAYNKSMWPNNLDKKLSLGRLFKLLQPCNLVFVNSALQEVWRNEKQYHLFTTNFPQAGNYF